MGRGTSQTGRLLDDFLDDLRSDRERAASVLEQKIGRYAADYKSARTLLRIAYLVLTADGAISPAKTSAFNEICLSLGVEPKEIWEKLAGSTSP